MGPSVLPSRETGKRSFLSISVRILKQGVKTQSLEPGELERFKQLLNEAIKEVDPQVLPRDTLMKVNEILEAYRSG